METFPSFKTTLLSLSFLLKRCDHLLLVILLDSTTAPDAGAGQLHSDHLVTHADLVLLFADLVLLVTFFECQPSQSCFCLWVCAIRNVAVVI